MSKRWPDINPDNGRPVPQMPSVVLAGVDAVGKLPQARPSDGQAKRLYGEDSIVGLYKWARSAARTLSCCAPDALNTEQKTGRLQTVLMSSATAQVKKRANAHRRMEIDTKYAPTYFPMAQRAMVKTGKVTIHTSGGIYEARMDELEEEERDEDADDDCEALVEPLRQTGAQAEVSKLVKRRREGCLEEYEARFIKRDLWNPEDTAAKYTLRRIQEVHEKSPWCSMLQPELHARTRPTESHEIVRKYKFPYHYEPTTEDIRRLRAVQSAHTQRVMEVIGAEASLNLGFADLSAEGVSKDWGYGHSFVPLLESGLANKMEGLESVRREKLPHLRLYHLAEYYYKVWRTLHTPEAQMHYINKCKNKKIDAMKKEQQRFRNDQKAARMQLPPRPHGPGFAMADGGMEVNGGTGPGAAGSAVSSPRFATASRPNQSNQPAMGPQWPRQGGELQAGLGVAGNADQLPGHMDSDDYMVARWQHAPS